MNNQENYKNSIPKPTHFGKNLKLLRRLNRFSQQELAKALNVNRNNIASYESGIVEPNAKLFLKVCEFFDRRPTEMLETVMIENVLDSSQNLEPNSDSATGQYVLENIEQFIYHTNEMTKVCEGYRALLEMKSEDNIDESGLGLYASFSDLLDLLSSLIKVNWKIIQIVFPQSSSEQE